MWLASLRDVAGCDWSACVTWLAVIGRPAWRGLLRLAGLRARSNPIFQLLSFFFYAYSWHLNLFSWLHFFTFFFCLLILFFPFFVFLFDNVFALLQNLYFLFLFKNYSFSSIFCFIQILYAPHFLSLSFLVPFPFIFVSCPNFFYFPFLSHFLLSSLLIPYYFNSVSFPIFSHRFLSHFLSLGPRGAVPFWNMFTQVQHELHTPVVPDPKPRVH